MRPFVALCLALASVACSGPGEAPSATASARWGRPERPNEHAKGDAGPVPTLDPSALSELLGAAASASAEGSTGVDGRSLVGTDTGERGEAPIRVFPRPAERVPAADEPPSTAPPGPVSDPSLRRAAKAQLFWRLVQKCRDSEGRILPPEVVHLRFELDADGTLATSSIVATPKVATYEKAAICMRRELSRSGFRASPSARGARTPVEFWIPATD